MLNEERKYCNKCNIKKPFSEFYKNRRSKDGLQNACKACKKLQQDRYNHTKQGLAASIHGHQVSHSKTRCHPLPNYSSQELFKWLERQINFDCLYLNWVNSGYDKNKRPSCDRIDDSKPYSFDNIQLTTWAVNNKCGNEDRKNGINNKMSKTVMQLTLSGELIKTHYSMCQASRDTGVYQSNISKCCRGERKYAGGYLWKFGGEI